MGNKNLLYGFIVLLFVLVLGHQITLQWDFTSDKRFSLSDTTKSKLDSVKSPIKIDIFLDGKLPADYLRLRSELKTLLTVMKNKNDKIAYEFIDLFTTEDNSEDIINGMTNFGMPPEMVYQTKNSTVNEFVVFPWAVINKGERSVRVNLLQKNLGDTETQKIQRSIQQLEYQLLDGIHQLVLERKKNIAVLTSHATSEDIKLTDFIESLKPYYNIAAFDLKADEISFSKSLENLQRFDALIVSNPKETFTLEEKYILDQFTLNGGKSLWLVNATSINRDSLFNSAGKAIGFPNELNLEDFFFKYGIRFQNKILKDLYSAPIVIAQGTENNTNFIPLPWTYYPLPKPEITHPIGKDVGNVFMRFTSAIDTLKNGIKKHILVYSSDFTKAMGTPAIVTLEEASKKINPEFFNKKKVPLAVLLDGNFESVFKNRIKPFNIKTSKNNGASQIIAISDGNFAENQTNNGRPLALGYDKWTSNFYANRIFLMNAVHFITGENTRISLRNKEVRLAFLDAQKVNTKGLFWKLIMIILPLIGVISVGLLNRYLRRIKYKH